MNAVNVEAAQEQALRAKVKELLGVDPAKVYRDLDLTYTFRDAFFIYALLTIVVGGGCVLFALLGKVAIIFTPVFAAISGVAFNWINVQVHEASHGLLLPGRKWNDIYCNILFGALGLQDVETYRLTHGMHHANLHTEKDPDLAIYTQNIGSTRAIIKAFSGDLFLCSVLRRTRQVHSFLKENGMAHERPPIYCSVAKATAQALIAAIYVYYCGAWGIIFYAGSYLLGLLGIFPVLVRIRTVVQHYSDELNNRRDAAPAPFISRTTVAPILEFLLVGARMDYHFEHHLYPTVPYYNLRRMHARLVAAGLFAPDGLASGLRTENYFQTYAYLAT
jgi:fatty acid desaturase